MKWHRLPGGDLPPAPAPLPPAPWCPTCGHSLRTCTWLGAPPFRPAPGMPALCGHCLGLQVFLGRGHYMRRATAADLVRLAEKMGGWDPSKMVPPWTV